MKFSIQQWGTVREQPVMAITLSSGAGVEVTVLTYGCIVQSLLVPDRNGKPADVVLGFDTLAPYVAGHPKFGAVCGRYANRIHEGRFSLNGKTYTLERNEAATGQHLHGGSKGFDKVVWGYGLEESADTLWLNLYHTSPDGDAGYPGRVDVVHSVGLDAHNRLWFNFRAVADADTVLNLVNHSYFNLAGVGERTVAGHDLRIAADLFTPLYDTLIPTGAVQPVEGTPFDFRTGRTLGEKEIYDVNFPLRNQSDSADGLTLAAELHHPASGRAMRVRTSQPGVQFYTGFKLDQKTWIGKGGAHYPACAGLCLETQHFPDSPNQPHFPTTTLKAGSLWEARTVHEFYVG